MHGALSQISAVPFVFAKPQVKIGLCPQGLRLGPSEHLLEIMDPGWKGTHLHRILHENSRRPQALGVLVKP
jgi:hypothetical protein